MDFTGPAISLAATDIAGAADRLGLEPAVIAAVAEVESSGGGFLPDTRPKILFERHVFSRRTAHVFDNTHPGISNPVRGGYGPGGAHQYDRLHEAMALDPSAALESASWGKFQVMGFNAELCGWISVWAFVTDMCKSEAQHLDAFIGYCQASDLIRHLATHNWRAFARGYNGPGNVDEYAPKLEAAYHKHAAAPTAPPDRDAWDKIRALQRVLGVKPDGDFRTESLKALNAVLRAAGQRTLRLDRARRSGKPG